MWRGETLALDYSVTGPDGAVLLADGAVLAGVSSPASDLVRTHAPGDFANRGGFAVAVTKVEASA
jgi:hypothetical protein